MFTYNELFPKQFIPRFVSSLNCTQILKPREFLISKRTSAVRNFGEEGAEGVEGDGEKEGDIDDEEDCGTETEDEYGEARDAAVHGVVREMEHDEKTREEYSQHEERIERSDKKFHRGIIPWKNGE